MQPIFHLSTEWGVPFGTVVIGIPFYLARPELTELHKEQVGHIEGFNRPDILRYLRHEMGHVINYAYKLYDDEQWVKLFGSITQPYLRGLPAAAVQPPLRSASAWLVCAEAPRRRLGRNICRVDDAGQRMARRVCALADGLAKLEFLRRTMARLADREPLVIGGRTG